MSGNALRRSLDVRCWAVQLAKVEVDPLAVGVARPQGQRRHLTAVAPAPHPDDRAPAVAARPAGTLIPGTQPGGSALSHDRCAISRASWRRTSSSSRRRSTRHVAERPRAEQDDVRLRSGLLPPHGHRGRELVDEVAPKDLGRVARAGALAPPGTVRPVRARPATGTPPTSARRRRHRAAPGPGRSRPGRRLAAGPARAPSAAAPHPTGPCPSSARATPGRPAAWSRSPQSARPHTGRGPGAGRHWRRARRGRPVDRRGRQQRRRGRRRDARPG